MKLVRENINEGMIPSEKVFEAKMKTIEYMRKSIFPKLDEDELMEFRETMKEWFS